MSSETTSVSILPGGNPVSASPLPPVRVERLVHGGFGLARTPEVRLVPLSMPGDQGHLQDKTDPVVNWQTLTHPSPLRVDARCDVFGRCGGCQWQHMPLATQRFWKQTIVAETLRRIGKLSAPYPLFPVMGDDLPGWQYRNKVSFHVMSSPIEQGFSLGLVGHNPTHRVEPRLCHLLLPGLQAAATAITGFSAEWPADVPYPGRVILRTGDAEGHTVLVLLEGVGANPALKEWALRLRERQTVVKAVACLPVAGGPLQPLLGEPWLRMTLGGHRFQVSADSFFQVNPAAAEWLMAETVYRAGRGETLLDLYAGVGVFSVALAAGFKYVLAVESHPSAIKDLRHNAKKLPQIKVLDAPVESSLDRLPKRPDVVIADPPRSGLDRKVRQWLAARVRRRILLVSCEPTTLARDLAVFLASGWRLTAIQPVDMFPQTYHIETLCILDRKR